MISICFTYFRSLALANLRAALFSVRQQKLEKYVKEIVVLDNNTEDTIESIQAEIDALAFPVPTQLYSFKHGDPTKTHAWSTNAAVRLTTASWVFFCRADYLLDFGAIERFASQAVDENRFVISGYYDVGADIGHCETKPWRFVGPSILRPFGREYDHVLIDAGVWRTARRVFDMIGGLNESLVVWGHAQTYFQHQVFQSGVSFIRIPEVLFYHPRHGHVVPQNIDLAHQQLKDVTGFSIKDLWARYDGPDHPYKNL